MKKIFLLLFVAIAGITPARALTLGDIKVQVRRIVADKSNPQIKFTDAELVSYVNEAQREIVNRTWCIGNRTTQLLTAHTTYYDLPTDLIAIAHVDFFDATNHTRELTEISEKAERESTPDYERIIGQPMQYFVRDSTGATATTTQIAFLPIPSSTTSVGTATIDYVATAVDLAAATDVPFNGMKILYPYHYSLVYSVTAKLKSIKGDPSAAQDLAMAQSYIALIIDRLGQMPNYNPGFRPATSK